MKYMVSVVIPAYKKTGELVENLRQNLPYLHDVEVIVVNDDPSCSIADQLTDFPSLLLIEHPVNRGFAGAVNTGIREARGKYVLLLNSDVQLLDTSWRRALERFTENPSLFAVSFAQRERDGSLVGKNRLFWHQGLMQHARAEDFSFGPTAWAEGGSALFDRNKIIEIGYFDEVYSPFYWEDIDLSYRARKHGYDVLFDPAIIVQHYHESTIGSIFSSRKIRSFAFRNQVLFVWANITDPGLLVNHLLWIPAWIVRAILSGNIALLAGLAAVLPHTPLAVHSRLRNSGRARVADDTILKATRSL